MTDLLPFRPGDWVSDDADRVARVKAVYRDDDDILLDLSIYSHRGDRLGRTSPVMGGPRTYEPACLAKHWQRIAKPSFPIRLQWVDDGKGGRVARMWAGDRLGPANWKKPERKRKVKLPAYNPLGIGIPIQQDANDAFRIALEMIAAGHNDARALAASVLAKYA